MRVLIWIVEGTWEGCVDAARAVLPADAEVVLVHVTAGEVAEAAEGATADLLVLARDGDRSRLGPHSLGPATRFVVDHAPARSCWPGRPGAGRGLDPAAPAHPPPPPGGP
jgi:hypothetical protein